MVGFLSVAGLRLQGACRLTPVEEAWGVTWLALSVGGVKLRSLLCAVLFVVSVSGRSVSKTLSNLALGWFNSAMRGLTLVVRGDLESHVDRRSWCRSTGEGAMAASALPIGFSLV